MKRTARFFSPLPAFARELYALPRWWMMLFFLLSKALWATLFVLQPPFGNNSSQTLSAFHAFLIIGGAVGAFVLCGIVGYRAARQARDDPRWARDLTGWTLLGHLLAGMTHVYLYFLASLPFLLVTWWFDCSNGFEARTLYSMLLAESTALGYGVLGLLVGASLIRGRSLLPFVPVVFLSPIFFISMIFSFDLDPIDELSWAYLPQIHFHVVLQNTTFFPGLEVPTFLASMLTHLVLGTLLFFLTKHLIRSGRDWRSPRWLFFAFWIAILWIFGTEAWTRLPNDFLIALCTAFLIAPLLLVPGHETIRGRWLTLQHASRWQRFCHPAGWAYLPLLAGTLIAFAPFVLHTWLEEEKWSDLVIVGMSLSIFFVWSCFIAALVEHCELYVRERGRMLATLVALLLLVAPAALASQHGTDKTLLFVNPYAWTEMARLTRINMFEHGTWPFVAQATVVGLAALGLHLWTDLQRRRLAAAQRKRIEEALHSSQKEGTEGR